MCEYCGTNVNATEALKAAKVEVENAKDELNAAMANKADASALTDAITNVNSSITAANNLIANNKDATDAEIDDLKQAVEDLKTEISNAVQKAANDLAEAKSELKKNIDDNAANVDELISELNKRIGTLEAFKTNLGDYVSQTAIDDAIMAAVEDAKADITGALDRVKDELNAAIAKKADAQEITEKITELSDKITALETIANTLGDTYAQKDDVANDIKKAKDEAITAASEALTAAKEELNAAIAKKADATTIETKIRDLNDSITNLEKTSKSYKAEISADIKADNKKDIEEAKGVLQAAIDALSARLDTAESRIADTESDVKLIKTFMYAVGGLVAVLGVLVIVILSALKRTVKTCVNGDDKK